jgi:putative transposase
MDQLDLKKQNELPPIPFCKRELVYHRHYTTREEAKQDIFEYIKVFYNRLRRHSTLGYYSPAEFEARTAVA